MPALMARTVTVEVDGGTVEDIVNGADGRKTARLYVAGAVNI